MTIASVREARHIEPLGTPSTVLGVEWLTRKEGRDAARIHRQPLFITAFSHHPALTVTRNDNWFFRNLQ